MTREELKDIRNKLKEWCNERKLNVNDQQKNLLGNILEECTEYARAKNEYEKIDAICDMIVFYLNSVKGDVYILQDNVAYEDVDFIQRILTLLSVNTECTNILNQCVTKLEKMDYDVYKCMCETIKEISSRKGEWNNDLGKFVKYIGVYSVDELYNAYENDDYKLVELEDSYEIEVNGEKKKYIKWYQADYKSCRKQ